MGWARNEFQTSQKLQVANLIFTTTLEEEKYLMLKNHELHITSYQQLAPYWRQLENWRGGRWGGVG